MMRRLPIPRDRTTLLQTCTRISSYSTTPAYSQLPKPSVVPPRPSSQPRPQQSESRLLPTSILLIGGVGVGLGAYYYYEPNAEVFKQGRKLIGIEEKRVGVISKATMAEERAAREGKQVGVSLKAAKEKEEQKRSVVASPQVQNSVLPPPPPIQKPAPTPTPPPVSIPASAIAASAINSTASVQKQEDRKEQVISGDVVPKNVLITALRAQQEALSESHDAKVKVIQSEYDRRLGNAVQVIEAERVVELRGKYEKASAALGAIEKGIEARTTQNERAKRLRSLWAQVNALHARVNHPEYHSSTVTTIDKPGLLRSAQVPDKFVAQMIESLPSEPVHSMESLKERFYRDVEPVAKSVGLIKDGEGFSLWKYGLGKVFSGGILEVVRMEGKSSKNLSPVQSTADALDSARRSLDKSDLISAAIAVNELKGLPRQVASDWLADARTLLETNQTLFVLMTYAASNNVF